MVCPREKNQTTHWSICSKQRHHVRKVLQSNNKSHMQIEYDPEKNHKAISIIEQEDGNWKGWMWRWGKLIEVRDVSPSAVLVTLLTSG